MRVRKARRRPTSATAPCGPRCSGCGAASASAPDALLAARRAARPVDSALAEVGCGSGGNLLELLRLGFARRGWAASNCCRARGGGARAAAGRVRCWLGDAVQAAHRAGQPGPGAAVHGVLVAARRRLPAALAAAMWRWLRPGGGVLWYDFTVDNPAQPRCARRAAGARAAAVPARARACARVTLAPPLARAPVPRCTRPLRRAATRCPLLRTHRLAWMRQIR
jgi:hypothetical protein